MEKWCLEDVGGATIKSMSIIDDLLKDTRPEQKEILNGIRDLVKELVPDATEVMTYGMPGFKYKGKYLVSFSGFKDHMSIFPGAEPIEALKDELKGFKSSKGTFQFTPEKQIPDKYLREMILLCKARIDD